MVQGSRSSLTESTGPQTPVVPRTILIVDDSPEDRSAHRRYLERGEEAPAEILEEGFGEKALEVCFERRPDCVLLDYQLPDMEALEFLQRLSEGGAGPIVPVVILTGALNEATAIEALKAGAHDYLVKGRVTREGIRIAIDSAIEKAALQRQVRDTEGRLRTALESMLDCFAILSAVRDPDGGVVDFRVEYANDKVCDVAGLTKRQISGRSFFDVVESHRRPELYAEYLRVMATAAPVFREVVIPDGSGEPTGILHAWDVRINPVDDGIAVAWRDITEQKIAEAEIVRMNQVLERRVDERTAALRELIGELEGFTYSVSHDLRAPLRAIASTSAIVLEEASDKLSDEHTAMLERQALNAKRLATLIDDLLRLSRISRQDLRKSQIDLSAMANEIAGGLEFAGGRAVPRFEIQEGLHAFGDAILLRLALLNLLDNAAKFSPEGGAVRFGAYQDGKSTVFFVRDQGIGFDMAYAHKLFIPFERLHRDDEFPGTGIGLANVQRIVHRHGGTVWAESTPGQGSAFYFSLPSEPPRV